MNDDFIMILLAYEKSGNSYEDGNHRVVLID